MALKSRFTVPVPNCTVHQWIFGSQHGPLPDKKAWIDPDRPDTHFLTYPEARLLAKRIAVGLLDNGLQPGNRVLVVSPNSIFFPVMLMGIWMAGGVFTGANPGCGTRELVYQLIDSQAYMILAAGANVGTALDAAHHVHMTTKRILLFDATMPDSLPLEVTPPFGLRHWSELIARRERGEKFQWHEPPNSMDATAVINYSSGTTGIPKGVEISHHNIVANGLGAVTLHRLKPGYEEQAKSATSLCLLPMCHAFSQGYFVSYFPYERVPVYVMSTFNFSKMLSHIQTYRITKLMAVPPILKLMSKHPLARQMDLSSLDMIGSGASCLPTATQQELDEMMTQGDSLVRQGWGMTEVTCTTLSWDPTRISSSAVGELMPNCRARLVDVETGKEITQPDTPGELWMAGPSIMRGYWRNPVATGDAIVTDQEGIRWLRTGDIAYVEHFGLGALFHIVDRVKELIRVKGQQVSPSELETLLLEHEDVGDAAVVGVLINGEEVPRAYIVKAVHESATTEEDIATWLADRVVRHKRLKGGVVFIDSIPKIASGKILRKTLHGRAKSEVGGEGMPLAPSLGPVQLCPQVEYNA